MIEQFEHLQDRDMFQILFTQVNWDKLFGAFNLLVI